MAEQPATQALDPSSSISSNPEPKISQNISLKREADPESGYVDGKRLKVGVSLSLGDGTLRREQSSTGTIATSDIVMDELDDGGRSGIQAVKVQSESAECVDTLQPESQATTNRESGPSKTVFKSASGASKKKEKKERNAGRRRGARGAPWGPKDASEANDNHKDAGDDGTGTSSEKTPRLPKRQCALLIGYCGSGCNGMQMYALYSLFLTFRAVMQTLGMIVICDFFGRLNLITAQNFNSMSTQIEANRDCVQSKASSSKHSYARELSPQTMPTTQQKSVFNAPRAQTRVYTPQATSSP